MEDATQTSAAPLENSTNDTLDLNGQISAALDEPNEEQVKEDNAGEDEGKPEETKESPSADNTLNVPDKFKDKDGNVNLENLLKSYTALEQKQSTDSANWQKERAELLKSKEQLDEINRLKEENAKKAGYASALEMTQSQEITNFEANEYAKYLQDCEEPEVVRQMLINYVNNPSQELMQEIELEFAPEVNKRIAIQTYKKKQEFETQKQEFASTQKMTNIENIISQSVDSNEELFGYEPFKKLFVNTLQKYGDNFTFEDAKALMDTVVELKDLFQKEFETKAGAKIENDKATDKLANITGSNSAHNTKQEQVSLNDLSEAEMLKVIRQLI